MGSVVVSRRMTPEKLESFDLSPPDHSEPVHVLAVDDSLVDRKVIERLLKITSCKVTAVESGRRALQFLGLDKEQSSDVGLKVDLIITDYCMPGMTGYELLKKIKESSIFREIPVVIMSSENVLTRIDRCLEEGAEDFIVKPVKLADVKRLRDYMTKDVKAAGNAAVRKREVPESRVCGDDKLQMTSAPPILSSASPVLFSSASPPCPPTPLDSPAIKG